MDAPDAPRGFAALAAKAKPSLSSSFKVIGTAFCIALLVVATFLVAIGGVSAWLLSGTDQGVAFGPDRARVVLATQRDLLDAVRKLLARVPLPGRDDPACRALAVQLGALDVHIDNRFDGAHAVIVYHRRGLAETYEDRLVWVPPDTAAAVRDGRLRLGEASEHIDDGWWWVWW